MGFHDERPRVVDWKNHFQAPQGMTYKRGLDEGKHPPEKRNRRFLAESGGFLLQAISRRRMATRKGVEPFLPG